MEKTVFGILPGEKRPVMAGECDVPASKSHTIRALIIAAFAPGESRLQRCLASGDTLSCRWAVENFGAKVRQEGLDWIVLGFGLNPDLRERNINVGNSGTTLYLIAAMAALMNVEVFFDGDAQIRKRSARPLLRALRRMGAEVNSADWGLTPFSIRGPIHTSSLSLNCRVSQYLSALLLAAPLIQMPKFKAGGYERGNRKEEFKAGRSEINQTVIKIKGLNEQPYAALTLSWLERQGILYDRDGWDVFRIPCNQCYRPFDMVIPADWSSATFLLVGAAITGGTVLLRGLDMEDSQGDKAVLGMLERMGCRSRWMGDGVEFSGGRLQAIEQDMNDTPDALPAMAVAACFAEGENRLLNVPQAREKETDRIAVMCGELRRLGADVRELEDGLVIVGRSEGLFGKPEGRSELKSVNGAESVGAPKSVVVDGHGDHRVVMALAIAGLRFHGCLSIQGAEAAEITFPGFFDLLDELVQR